MPLDLYTTSICANRELRTRWLVSTDLYGKVIGNRSLIDGYLTYQLSELESRIQSLRNSSLPQRNFVSLTRKKIDRIKNVLQSMGIQFTEVDIAEDADMKDKMRLLSGNPIALPPQLFKDDVYLGNYDSFDDAVEAKDLKVFLKLE